ncbi:MAG: class I SAM-dependent methyltransferase [Sphingomonadales bacterium]|nr:class I SAM-dependent methyltransferase [Sphingomonadales bacterium]NCQ22019.1 class I SAM-dependent methyltransferase [Sphingomonadales bacterium]NCT03658.1 class I SAM-dependent methyltransferase [Sphingomonadales bacterium]
MKKLILIAAASGLALAAPLLAHQHMDHSAHSEAHVLDTAAFNQMHGEAVSGAINHPTRAEDRLRDVHRNPAEVLAFFHVGPEMKVGEYSPGGGWYSRLLGHYLGGEGQLVGLYNNPMIATADPARQQRVRDQAAGFGAEVAGYTNLPADRFSGLTLDKAAEQKGTFDRILVIRAMHGITRAGIADTEIRAMRELLKDDGYLGIVQHRAKADAPWSYANGSKGYLKQQDVIDFMRLNGFELVAESEINANPKDPANHAEGVWEMPPVQATKRADLAGLGESDRMTLLFKKAM